VTGGEDVTRQQQAPALICWKISASRGGIPMPKLKVMQATLNAFATGLNQRQYAITRHHGPC
jgi:hypothetical protein